MRCRATFRVCLSLTATLLLAQAALASEEAHHGVEHAAHGIPWGTLLLSVINFSLFVGVLARFVWPAIKVWVRERHASVVEELEAAARARAEAEALRADWQARMDRLEADLNALRAEAQRDLANERERVIASATKAAEGIRRDAERAAAAEVRRVQEQLRAEMVKAAVHLATDATRKGWSAEDQQRSIGDFLKQVQ